MRTLVLCLCIALAGCGAFSKKKVEPGTGLVSKNLVKVDSMPEGTVARPDGTYMIPLNELEPDGCRAYRLYAPGRLTAEVLYYQRWDESFTMNKQEAACYGARK